MRFLLLHHYWRVGTPSVDACARIAVALSQAGHEVRVLALGDCEAAPPPPAWLTIVPFDDSLALGPMTVAPNSAPPRFAGEPGPGLMFIELSDEQLAIYRARLRSILDQQIDGFNPHLIHAHHLWVWAQLALETGAPYVVLTQPDEFEEQAIDDHRFRELALQAAENATYLFVASEQAAARVAELYGELETPVTMLPPEAELPRFYAAAARQRLGPGADLR